MKKIIAGVLTVVVVTTACVSVSADTRETWVSDDIYSYCEEIGAEYNICPELLMAIIERESSGQATAQNGSCVGLMQVSSIYHSVRASLLGVSNLYDERGNILVAADYLAELFEEYGDVCYVLDIYNGNSKAAYNYENGIVSTYAGAITERATELERLHDEDFKQSY